MKKIEFKRLKKWENELNICIRCGYCYEQCHLFKQYNWETDTPRGKLLLIYAMITGVIEPSKYIAEKIFQCFYCKNCSKNCSAKLPITDIFTDARADLIDAGFDIENSPIIEINPGKCRRCLTCVSVCKAGALSIDTKHRKIIVDRVKCKGCGVCLALCPAEAITQKDSFEISRNEIFKKIIESLKKTKIIVFCCNWSIYPEFQLSRIESLQNKKFEIIVTMCAGRIDPRLIIDAFYNGANGVMVACCPPDMCENNGNLRIEKKISSLKNLFEQIDINPERLSLEYIATGEVPKFKEIINKFVDKITLLGPIL